MENIKSALEQFKNKHILVVGDIMLDWYTYGKVTRVSPEAPVPVLHKTHDKFVLGGAANVAHNIRSLGAKVTLAGTVGDDDHKDKIFALTREHKIGACILLHKEKPTIIKHRLVTENYQQLLRLDAEDTHFLDDRTAEQLYNQIDRVISSCDIVIFSDYAKGTLTPLLAGRLIARAHQLGKQIVADIKPNTKDIFRGVDVICPNIKESREMTGCTEDDDVELVGKRLVDDLGSAIVMTRGGEGVSVFDKSGEHTHLPSVKVSVADITGAGDTIIAVAALGLAAHLELADAARLANIAAGIVVQKPGVASVFVEELESALGDIRHTEGLKVVEKKWGYEKWLENNEKYCCKLLVLNKGYQCSMHYHKSKDEMFLIIKGHVRLELDKKVLHMLPGHYVRLWPGAKHRFTGMKDSEILEVSTHHEEEDSYREEESGKAEDMPF